MKVECFDWKAEVPYIYKDFLQLEKTQESLRFDAGAESYYSFGKYVGFFELKEQKKSYHMELAYEIQAQRGKLMAYLTFYKKDGRQVTRREYFVKSAEKAMSIDFQCGADEWLVKAEICFSCFGAGSCNVKIPCFELNDPPPARKVKVAPAYFMCCCSSVEENFRQVLRIVDNAGTAPDKPDILCFTETVYDRGVKLSFADRFIPEEKIPLCRLEEKARQYQMYIIFSAHEISREDNLRYNTAYLISPEGKIAGKYRKTHLTMTEYEVGMVPGNEIPVFDTPFGKIGILICWDQWFPEAARILQLEGAEIIFWQTAGYHENKMRARAVDSAAYMVTACSQNPAYCSVTDPAGNILGRLYDVAKGYLTVELDLNKKFYESWLSIGDGYGSAKDLFLNERRRELYQPLLSDGVFASKIGK